MVLDHIERTNIKLIINQQSHFLVTVTSQVINYAEGSLETPIHLNHFSSIVGLSQHDVSHDGSQDFK